MKRLGRSFPERRAGAQRSLLLFALVLTAAVAAGGFDATLARSSPPELSDAATVASRAELDGEFPAMQIGPAVISVTESLQVGELAGPETGPSTAVSEGLIASDEANLLPSGFARASQAVGVVDSANVGGPEQALAIEAVGVRDAVELLPAAQIHAVESIGVGNATSSAGPTRASIAESVRVADAVALRGAALVLVSERLVADDALALAGPVSIAVAEGIGLVDVPRTLPAARIEVRERLGVSDHVKLDPSVLIEVEELLRVSDVPMVRGPARISVTEAIGVGDEEVMRLAALVKVRESIGIEDSSDTSGPALVNVADRIGVRDAVTPLPIVLLVVEESLRVADAPQSQGPATIDIHESLRVTDVTASRLSARVFVTERVTLADATPLDLAALIYVSERLGVEATAGYEPAALVAIQERLSVGDGIGTQRGDDLDGIEAGIDGHLIDGAFIDESDISSSSFTDQGGGGTTSGGIAERDGLDVVVTNVVGGGVSVKAFGGGGTALVQVCDSPVYELALTAGDESSLTCGSLKIEVFSGTVEVTLPGGDLLIAPATATVQLTSDGANTEVSNSAESGTAVTVVVDGESLVIDPGGGLATDDPDGDGVTTGDGCPFADGPADRDGCPFEIRASVSMNVVDRSRSGECPDGDASCSIAVEAALVRIFDLGAPDFVAVFAKKPKPDEYPSVFDSGVGVVASCETDAEGGCIVRLSATTQFLVLARFETEAAPSEMTIVYAGALLDEGDFVDGVAVASPDIVRVLSRDGTSAFRGELFVLVVPLAVGSLRRRRRKP